MVRRMSGQTLTHRDNMWATALPVKMAYSADPLIDVYMRPTWVYHTHELLCLIFDRW